MPVPFPVPVPEYKHVYHVYKLFIMYVGRKNSVVCECGNNAHKTVLNMMAFNLINVKNTGGQVQAAPNCTANRVSC